MSIKQRHTAIAYDKRGRVIAIGHNSYVKSHPLQHHFARLVGKPDSIYLHAEIACLLRAGTQRIHRLSVSRTNGRGVSCSSDPCSICQLAIKYFGVKIVEHT